MSSTGYKGKPIRSHASWYSKTIKLFKKKQNTNYYALISLIIIKKIN